MHESSPEHPSNTRADCVREAGFYARLEDGRVRCELCPRLCQLAPGATGYCRVRQNRGGQLISLVYGQISALNVDPIEKKPFFHFLPGTRALSLGTAGCNLHCRFCQNWNLAGAKPGEISSESLTPDEVVQLARRHDCVSVAFTYNEPAVFAEFALDCAEAAHRAGLRAVAISNGYLHPAAVRAVYSAMDAVKIDLKSFSDSFYKQITGARLKPVLDSLLELRALDKWLEIVCLLIPGLNDSDEELRAMAAWINSYLGSDVPLHFSRFYPQQELRKLAPTPVDSLERARTIALDVGLNFVYIGNVPGHAAQNTHCPACAQLLVERADFSLKQMSVVDGRCPACSHAIAGLWQQ